MKKINLLFPMIWAVLLLASCVKEDLDCPFKLVKEGVPVQMTLNYTVDANRVVTRAAQESEYEFSVHNLYVFIFDSQGAVHYRGFFDASSMSVDNGDETNPTTGNVSFETTTVNNAKIVGIANLTTTGVAAAYQVTKTDLDNIETLDALEEYVMTLRTNSISRGASFMMTGYGKGNAGSTDITISADESGNARVDCTLKLERTDAKVEFLVTSEAGDHSWSNFTFTPKTWNVMQVPSQSLLLPAEEVKDAEGEYFDVEDLPFEDVDAEKGTGSFVFYMPENRKSPKKAIEGDDYALRDLNDKQSVSGTSKPGQTEENLETFTYANDNSTYVVLTGNLSYQTQTGLVNADVRYIIHLGYASEDPSDFDTKRNVHYTYNVTIKGVNDIVVEVTSENDNEVRPGYEGDVVYSANQVFNLDSHYDRCQLVINKSAIEGMTWGVKTPFSSGIHAAGATEVEDYLKDYKWVKFAINADFDAGENQFVKYPGDSDNRLMDVHQLIERLKDERNDSQSSVFGSGNNVYITAFVEENVYFTNPNNGQEDLLLWKESVDKDDRLLHIITDDAVYSADGNSSVVNSLYTFKQKAVRTVFDVNNPDLKTAWGLESVMETDRLPMFDNGRESMSDYRNGNTTNNGRKNMLAWVEGKTWTDIIETAGTNAYELKSDYEAAAYACMLRNRDLDGDDVIDENEVRWYLASIDQLVDIYLGEYALDVNSRLYPRGSSELDHGVYWHYASSSYNSRDNNSWILWAEEGASRGSYSTSVERRGNSNFAYRCVRNLGVKLENRDDVPTDLVIMTPDPANITETTNVTFDLSRMNPKARRSVPSVISLGNHDETRDINRPYVKFEMEAISRNANQNEAHYDYKWSIPVGGEFKNSNTWSVYRNSSNACPAGYHIPNQRELLIMATRLPSNAWETFVCWGPAGILSYSAQALYMCQTSFSMVGYSYDDYSYTDERQTFIWNPGNGGVFYLQNETSERGYVRCVRDLQ